MKKRLAILSASLVVLLLAACSAAPETAVPTQMQNTIPPTAVPSFTKFLTRTLTVSPTPAVSDTPTITLTSGPPPDLELKNVAIYPKTFQKAGQNYFLFGRVRNNSDSIMVFNESAVVFKIKFDVWEFNSDYFAKEYRHVIYVDETKLGSDRSRHMNCILYPGEEGVFYYETRSNRGEYILDETMKRHDGPLGIGYTYESFYHTQPDLPMYYHPKAENVVMKNESNILVFDFDLDVPDLLERGVYYSDLTAWMILYDEEGNILNVLTKRVNEMGGLEWGKPYHFHSNTILGVNKDGYLKPAVDLTVDLVQQVDRVEVFVEMEEGSTCTGSGT